MYFLTIRNLERLGYYSDITTSPFLSVIVDTLGLDASSPSRPVLSFVTIFACPYNLYRSIDLCLSTSIMVSNFLYLILHH